MKHALNSTAAQLSGDTVLQYITTTQYPGTWRGSSHAFVLHWKEQIMKYEKFKFEAFPPKQKLSLLQNAVGDIAELSYIKQIGDQDVAQGYQPLTYERYIELLLLACSTYDKKLNLSGKQKRAAYQTKIGNYDETECPHDDIYDSGYKAYHVDTDILDMLVNNTNTNCFGSNGKFDKAQATFLPRDEWDTLTQERKDYLIAKKRQERMNLNNSKSKPFQPKREVNAHNVADTVKIDDIIDYTINTHEIGMDNDNDDDAKALDSGSYGWTKFVLG
jgi:hypothetical protein